MASISLNQAYMHTAADLADYDVFYVTSIGGADAWDAQRRSYTAGRQRLVTGDTTTMDAPVTLRHLSIADRENLRVRGGVLQMLRLPHGIKRYGFFAARDVTELGWGEYCDVTLVFQQVTVSEAV